MNSPFRGWASWVIELLTSPEGGMTAVTFQENTLKYENGTHDTR
jgi:hypothetical protein